MDVISEAYEALLTFCGSPGSAMQFRKHVFSQNSIWQGWVLETMSGLECLDYVYYEKSSLAQRVCLESKITSPIRSNITAVYKSTQFETSARVRQMVYRFLNTKNVWSIVPPLERVFMPTTHMDAITQELFPLELSYKYNCRLEESEQGFQQEEQLQNVAELHFISLALSSSFGASEL